MVCISIENLLQNPPAAMFLCIAIVLVCLSFYTKKKKKTRHCDRLPLPPGSLGLPFIGETLQFYRAHRSNRLLQDFLGERIRKHGRVFKTAIMGRPTVVLMNGPAGNRFLLSNEFKLVVSSWPAGTVELMGPQSIMQKRGEHHRRLRGAMATCLGAEALKTSLQTLTRLTQRHFALHWQGRHAVRVFPLTKLLTFSSVCALFLGIEEEGDAQELLQLFETVLQGSLCIPVDVPGTRYRRARIARSAIDRFLRSLVHTRRRDLQRGRASPDQDLLSRLLTLHDQEGRPLSDVEVVDNIVLLIFAAHDTSSLVMTMMCKMLCQHKHCYAQMLREHRQILRGKKPGEEPLRWEDTKQMKYTWRVAQETMRLFPPIFGSFREALVDIEYAGYRIPKGWKVINNYADSTPPTFNHRMMFSLHLLVFFYFFPVGGQVLWTTYGTHYDGEYFPEPQEFEPSRFEDTIPAHVFLPFGGGVRLCAGYELAKMQIAVFMHHLISRYEWCLVDPNERMRMDPLLSPQDGLPIRLTEKLIKERGMRIAE